MAALVRASSIVTNQEIVDYVTGAADLDTDGNITTPALVQTAKGITEAVQGYCGRVFAETDYEDEQYRIERLTELWDGLIAKPRQSFLLNQFPVTDLSTIKTVSSWNTTTGEPDTTAVVPRQVFRLESPESRVVVFSSPIGVPLGTSLYFPTPTLISPFVETNAITLLVTYTAGYAAADIPDDLKLAVLQEILREFKLRDSTGFHKQSDDGQFGSTQFTRSGLSPEAMRKLTRYRKRLGRAV